MPDLNEEEGESMFILDIGCGSGLSSEIVEEYGHFCMGLDISPSMLEVNRERELSSEVLLSDMGHGLNLKPGFFDAAISVSAL